MEWLSALLKPQIIGPLIGLVAVLGWIITSSLKAYFTHQERIEMIRQGMDPGDEEEQD